SPTARDGFTTPSPHCRAGIAVEDRAYRRHVQTLLAGGRARDAVPARRLRRAAVGAGSGWSFGIGHRRDLVGPVLDGAGGMAPGHRPAAGRPAPPSPSFRGRRPAHDRRRRTGAANRGAAGAAGTRHPGQRPRHRAQRRCIARRRRHRAAVALGLRLSRRRRPAAGGIHRPAGHAGGTDGRVPDRKRRRDPQLLDPAPGRQDRRHSRAHQRAAAAGRPGRAHPRPVRGVLRARACVHGLRGARAGTGRVRGLAARQRRGAGGGGQPMSEARIDTLPPEENRRRLEALARIWNNAPGWRGQLTAVNHGTVGLRFIATGFAFLLAGGALAMFIRLQLAWPGNQVLDPERYAQFVTLHGTTMMFLFAVPIMEGFAMYLLPKMLGARDLPFPRLGAFGYWCYLFGGLFLYSGLLFGEAPDGGWFMYVPLTDATYSPGRGVDFWLIGVTFAEIAAVTAAVEL